MIDRISIMLKRDGAVTILFYVMIIPYFYLLVWPNQSNANDCMHYKTGNDVSEISSILHSGGFLGLLDSNAELKPIGSIKKSNKCFDLFLYTYTSKIGAQHMTKRLIILSQFVYLGSYAIDEVPINIVENVVNFPGNETEGNSITFTDEAPPQKIYLDGEVRCLFK
jgi:hypothetical protein